MFYYFFEFYNLKKNLIPINLTLCDICGVIYPCFINLSVNTVKATIIITFFINTLIHKYFWEWLSSSKNVYG